MGVFTGWKLAKARFEMWKYSLSACEWMETCERTLHRRGAKDAKGAQRSASRPRPSAVKRGQALLVVNHGFGTAESRMLRANRSYLDPLIPNPNRVSSGIQNASMPARSSLPT